MYIFINDFFVRHYRIIKQNSICYDISLEPIMSNINTHNKLQQQLQQHELSDDIDGDVIVDINELIASVSAIFLYYII